LLSVCCPAAARAEVLFEIPDIYGTANLTWGTSDSGILKIDQFIFPHADQQALGVCEVGAKQVHYERKDDKNH
jgi:hypothetical protein